MKRRRALAAALAATVLATAGAGFAGAAGDPSQVARSEATDQTAYKKQVKKLKTAAFGTVLVTLRNKALYYWTPEKRNRGKIFCTGACAKAWPVLYVPKGAVVPRKIPGFKGVFGTIRRPGGRLQLTYNRLPLYTYAHEGPGQILCNDVDGWFVVRA